MKFSVHITRRAKADIVSLHEYISTNASTGRADAIASGIETLCLKLTEFPRQEHLPPELEGRPRSDIRELRYKPYRILYRVQASRVDVLAVFDGRRDARALIDQRLMRDENFDE